MELLIILLILGVVQGIAEFLPISSSGHLVLLEQIPYIRQTLGNAGEDLNMLINVALHVATLIAVVIYLRKDLKKIIIGLAEAIKSRNLDTPDTRIVGFILLASLPAGVAGILIKDFFEHFFSNPLYTFAFLIINGFLLIATKRIPQKNRQLEETGVVRSLVVGLFQAVAILPGISRSGMTIAGGLISGLAPANAAIFSFLMSIPVIGGAGILEGRKLLGGSYSADVLVPLAIAMVITVIVALASIRLLFEMVKRIKLDIFGYYTLALGIAGIILTLAL